MAVGIFFIAGKNIINTKSLGNAHPAKALGILYPQKLALTSPTSGGRLVGRIRLRTKGHGV
jgi:hypothetical protein